MLSKWYWGRAFLEAWHHPRTDPLRLIPLAGTVLVAGVTAILLVDFLRKDAVTDAIQAIVLGVVAIIGVNVVFLILHALLFAPPRMDAQLRNELDAYLDARDQFLRVGQLRLHSMRADLLIMKITVANDLDGVRAETDAWCTEAVRQLRLASPGEVPIFEADAGVPASASASEKDQLVMYVRVRDRRLEDAIARIEQAAK